MTKAIEQFGPEFAHFAADPLAALCERSVRFKLAWLAGHKLVDQLRAPGVAQVDCTNKLPKQFRRYAVQHSQEPNDVRRWLQADSVHRGDKRRYLLRHYHSAPIHIGIR